MKAALLILLTIGLGFGLTAQDKKELKELEDKYGYYSNGKLFEKNDDVAILGANVRFIVAKRKTETTSWKSESTVKFGAYAVLEGVSDEVFQEIADEYLEMLKMRFADLNMNVLPREELVNSKNYEKLKEKGLNETENVKKAWGVAKTYSGGNGDYITWNNAAPFGPHTKVPAELKAVLFNSTVTLNFAFIGIQIDQETSRWANSKTVYTKGEASVVPAVHVVGHTYNDKAVALIEDNTYNFAVDPKAKQNNIKLDLNISDIVSEINYAESTESCEGCEPEFAKSYMKIMEAGIGTIVVQADPVKFKEASLDALSKYLDEVFTLYKVERGI